MQVRMPQALVFAQEQRIMAGNVAEFTDVNFQSEVLGSSQPVLVDFWAPWCGPCKMIAPTIEAVAGEYLGKARVGKLNTDDNPKIATEYNISAIPALLVFKGGKVVDRFVGVVNKDKLATALNAQLG
jgi:thioredoxin 1